MKSEWLAFLSAVQFLTRLPIPDPGWEDGRLDRSAKWFPLVGALVGLICGAAAFAFSALGLSPLVSILLILCVAVLVTGALHEDGLADTADGIGGGRDRAHRLSIMKDSSIGSYGALALILAIGLRIALYTEVAGSTAAFAAALIAAHTISRLSMTGIVWSLPYARDETSAKIAPLSGKAGMTDRSIAALTGLIALAPVFYFGGFGAAAAGILVSAFAMLGLRTLYLRKLGGWTGDTAGATQVLCEITFLIGLTAWI